jgi:hypothetical protein
MIDLNIAKFKKNLELHHDLYPEIPLDNKLLESIFERSLFGDVKHDTGSHSIGYDLIVSNKKISVKSGKYKSNRNLLIFSSHRTTSHNTIEEKVKFIDEDHFDYQYNFAKVDDWKKTKAYKLIVFKKEQLKVGELNFEKNDSGWLGENDNIRVSIKEKMSDQVWYTINLNKIKPLKIIDFNVPQYDLEWLSNGH